MTINIISIFRGMNLRNIHRNLFCITVNISLLYSFSIMVSRKKCTQIVKKQSLFLNASFVEMKTILLSCKQNKHSLGVLIISLCQNKKSFHTLIWNNERNVEAELQLLREKLYNLNAVNHWKYSWQWTWDTHFSSTCLSFASEIFLAN